MSGIKYLDESQAECERVWDMVGQYLQSGDNRTFEQFAQSYYVNSESSTTVATLVGQMMEGEIGLPVLDSPVDIACGKCCFGCNDYDEEFVREVQNA